MNIFELTITALAVGLIFVEVLDIGRLYKKARKISPFEYIKPFDCVVCMTFWTSIILSLVFAEDWQTKITAPALTFFAVYYIDKLTLRK